MSSSNDSIDERSDFAADVVASDVIYESLPALSDDMRELLLRPDLCDVVFITGADQLPIHAIRGVLSIRSRQMHKLLSTAAAASKKQKAEAKVRLQKLTKLTSSADPLIVTITDFDARTFAKLIEYIHYGTLHIDTFTAIGLLSAADYFGLDEIRDACFKHVTGCLRVDDVCRLLQSVNMYIQYKSTKIIIQKALSIMAQHASLIFKQTDFYLLPEDIVRMMLSRSDLKATEELKFEAASRWCECRSQKNQQNYLELLRELIPLINFEFISAEYLMKNVKPLGLLSDDQLISALAFQASSESSSLQSIEASDEKPTHNAVLEFV